MGLCEVVDLKINMQLPFSNHLLANVIKGSYRLHNGREGGGGGGGHDEGISCHHLHDTT